MEKEELTLWKEQIEFQIQMMRKAIDDVMWFHMLGDVAIVDKVRYVGPPPANTTAQSHQDKGNPVIVPAYTFIPKNYDPAEKYPLMILVHGGVHSNQNTNAAHIIRELIEQGYVVVSPDYRGSTGYGPKHYKLIDYGGLEVEDVYEGRNWALENLDMIDPERIGIMGWSHGGLITLMNLFEHPDQYKVGYAGVPVSDLIARMGYKGQKYHELYSADYHIGSWAHEDPNEYRRRSPAWNAHKLQTPLMIDTNTADEDVNSLEVEHLIKALKAEGKDFEYKIYENAPGGHVFNRIDTKAAKESRKNIYRFLAKYLSPPNAVE